MSDVRPSDSVRAVKEEIERLVGVPAEQQRLVYYACCQAGLQTRHHCRFLKMGDEKTVQKLQLMAIGTMTIAIDNVISYAQVSLNYL